MQHDEGIDWSGDRRVDRRGPGVVVPPPLIFAAFLAAGIAIDRFVTRWTTFVPPVTRHVLASLLCLAGLVLVAWALGLFRKSGTRAEPWQPSSVLVVEGVYRFTRNPMYLGMAAIYAGVALLFDSAAALLLGIPLLLIIRYAVIAREERYLLARFGDDYRRYMDEVRRWL